MPKPKVNYSQLTHEVVQHSQEPLTIDEIITRINAITPITTKNPKRTIRNAVTDSQLIVSDGAGHYGWKPRSINDSSIRHTLRENELEEYMLYYGEDLRDALWPTFFAKQKYRNLNPITITLPSGTQTNFTLEHIIHNVWGSPATPEFYDWIQTLQAEPGDHLIFRVIDGEARIYAVIFERRSERDEGAITARNQAIIAAGKKRIRRQGVTLPWEITTPLLATGMYQHPIPPDPLEELWRDMKPDYKEDVLSPENFSLIASALFGDNAQILENEGPSDLPLEYDPDKGQRRPRLSRLARLKSIQSYTFRVNHRAFPEVWRDIELAEDNTLEDLHLVIQQAYSWRDDHLYSFFLGGHPWDASTEVGSPWSDSSRCTHNIKIKELDLKEGQVFLYLFDYGDAHEFDLTVKQINPMAPKGEYPRILTTHGESPPQYPDFDERLAK